MACWGAEMGNHIAKAANKNKNKNDKRHPIDDVTLTQTVNGLNDVCRHPEKMSPDGEPASEDHMPTKEEVDAILGYVHDVVVVLETYRETLE